MVNIMTITETSKIISISLVQQHQILLSTGSLHMAHEEPSLGVRNTQV